MASPSEGRLGPIARRTAVPPVAERVPVLMYHQVRELDGGAASRHYVTPARFAAHMQALAGSGFKAVPVGDFVAWLDGGPALPAGSFVLSFDDGYLGVRDHALPVLERLGWPFAVFLVTDFLGHRDHWARNDEDAAGRWLLLGEEDVLAMRARGADFHSHSRSHASLPGLDDTALEAELSGSRRALAALRRDDAAIYLAYPYGRVDERVESAARAAGYRAGFSVQPGFNRRDTPAFRIRRLDVFGTDTPRSLLRKVRLGTNDGSLRTALQYYWRQAVGSLRRDAA